MQYSKYSRYSRYSSTAQYSKVDVPPELCDNNDIQKVLNSDEQRIAEIYAREIVSGSTKFSKLTCL